MKIDCLGKVIVLFQSARDNWIGYIIRKKCFRALHRAAMKIVFYYMDSNNNTISAEVYGASL